MHRAWSRAALAAPLAFAAAISFAQLPAARATHAEPEVARGEPGANDVRVAPALPAVNAAHVFLAAPSPAAYPKELVAPAKLGTPLQVGFGRSVVELQDEDRTAAHLAWQRLDDGTHAAAVSVTSAGAAALRMGLDVIALPRGARLRFHRGDGSPAFEVPGEEVVASIARNLAAGENAAAARIYWSPVIEGDSATLEIVLPPGARTSGVRLAAPMVSHLVVSPEEGFGGPKLAACEIDAACYTGTWSSESNAEARMVFTSGGSSYVCSGTLLADNDASSAIPYFLTANHCISSQAAASSLQTYWFYRASACDSGTAGPYRTLTGGATLLYASGATDTSFMRLNAPPPAGAVFAGWTLGPRATGTSVTGLHYPGGGLQKISFGAIGGYWSCSPSGSGQFTCDPQDASTSTFYSIAWSSGATEPGSSGSGLFTDDGHYLVGQLYGGTGACTSSVADYYGRFDVAYDNALWQWLGTSSAVAGVPSTPLYQPGTDYTDLWWNPNESGWGLSIVQHADATIFAAWYLYDGSGRPTWIVMPGGSWVSPTSFQGDLYSGSGPDPVTGAFDPALVVRTKVGSGRLDFSAPDRATLTYTVNGLTESRAIQVERFGTPAAQPAVSYTDLWWNPSESGWGISIHEQYDALFAIWYEYRGDGSPEWLVMSGGSWTAPDTFTGTLYRTAYGSGRYFGAPFDPGAVARTAVGTLALRFTSATTATMTYSVDGVVGSRAITRQSF